jgi:hypothetical protein
LAFERCWADHPQDFGRAFSGVSEAVGDEWTEREAVSGEQPGFAVSDFELYLALEDQSALIGGVNEGMFSGGTTLIDMQYH